MPAIETSLTTSGVAKELRRLLAYGMNLADFAAISTGTSFSGFGNGTGYTVSNWISDGVFANLAAAQAVYPIIQDGNDHVDWVLLQSAVDFLTLDAIGEANGAMKRKLLIPAGHFLLNRTLHIGYGSMGTPPVGMNGNKYVTITLEGEGRQVDPSSGDGLTGTTILTENYTYPGIVITGGQFVQLRGFTLMGPMVSWMANNTPYRDSDAWDLTAWRDPAITDDGNWISGDKVHIGIGFDLYSDGTAAGAYPARVLPSYYGGGTTTGGSSSAGTGVEIEDVKVMGYVIGIGRPHGDNNGEFYRLNNCDIDTCINAFVVGASQARNTSLTNVNIELCRTGITNVGGLRENANLHGLYQNIHFGRLFQIFEHTNSGWSGPLTLRDCYAESFMRLGSWGSGRVKLDGCYMSFLEQEGTDGVAFNHYECGHLILDNTTLTGLRHGLMSSAAEFVDERKVEITNSSSIYYGSSKIWTGHANLTDIESGVEYMRGLFHRVGGNSRRFHSDYLYSSDGEDNYWHLNSPFTFLDQKFTSFYAQYPMGPYPDPSGSNEMQGSVQRFPVPKISRVQLYVTVASRSTYDLTCGRTQLGDIKADVGDVFAFYPPEDGSKARYWTWFIVVSISGTDMVLRQLSNFNSTTSTDYQDNGLAQVTAGNYLAEYICTRVRQNRRLWVGDVTSGSAVISNVRFAFQYGTTDQFNDTNFDMTVGDYFLHQEIERSASSGGVKVHNLVDSIDYSANTITLTENFNITQNAYPIVFYVRQFNA